MGERLITVDEVVHFTGLSIPTIYRHIRTGDFPKPIKLGRGSRWVESELMAWLEAKKAERDA
ncbi:helix-turn-helix transcriptional regulator [Aquitalea denitrificans]|uniref:helix-turn-helix transcriptional regulator n=1 Tax=Aquitalea denitrificans TaxID=519081 RepID=UPI001358CD10